MTNQKNCKVIICEKNEALKFLKTKIQYDKIICLSQESKIILKKNNITSIKELDIPDINFYKKIYEKKNHLREIIIDFFYKHKKISLASIEFLEHASHVSLNSAFYIYCNLYDEGPWLIYDNDQWFKVNSFNEIFKLVYFKIYNNKKLNIFQHYYPLKNNNNILLNIVNSFVNKLIKNKKIVWISGINYNFDKLIHKIHNKNTKVIFVSIDRYSKYSLIRSFKNFYTILNPLIKLKYISLNVSLSEKFKIDSELSKNLLEIDFNEIHNVKEFILSNLIQSVKYIEELKLNLKNILNQINSKCFITYELKNSENSVLGNLAYEKNIPVFLISHGTHTLQDKEIAKNESYNNSKGLLFSKFASKSIIQSKLALECLENYSDNFKYLKSMPVTWSIDEEIRYTNIKNNKLFTILHASTPKPIGVRPIIYENLKQYIDNLTKIIDTVNDINAEKDNIRIIIRARNMPDCSFETLCNLLPKSKNVLIRKNGKFLDDLNISNLLISYSSTTIEESLYAKVPVLLFDLNDTYKHVINSSQIPPNKNFRSSIYSSNGINLKTMLVKIIKYHKNKLLENEVKEYIWSKKDLKKDNLLNVIIDNCRE